VVGDRVELFLILLSDANVVCQNATAGHVETLVERQHAPWQGSATASLLERDQQSTIADGKQYNPHINSRHARWGRVITAAYAIHRGQLLHSLVACAAIGRVRNSGCRS
jgi:hypothetical protein